MTTINTAQLRAILSYLQIPSDFYHLGEYGLRDQHVCMEKKAGKWEVFYSEHGNKFDLLMFDNETDACLDLLNRVVHMEW